MAHDFWTAILLILQYIGIVSLSYVLTLRLLRTDKGAISVLVLPVGASDDVQNRLYAQHLRREMLCEKERCAIIALDTGLLPQQKRALQHFCRTLPQMYCCTLSELPAMMEKVQNDTRQ